MAGRGCPGGPPKVFPTDISRLDAERACVRLSGGASCGGRGTIPFAVGLPAFEIVACEPDDGGDADATFFFHPHSQVHNPSTWMTPVLAHTGHLIVVT